MEKYKIGKYVSLKTGDIINKYVLIREENLTGKIIQCMAGNPQDMARLIYERPQEGVQSLIGYLEKEEILITNIKKNPVSKGPCFRAQKIIPNNTEERNSLEKALSEFSD